MSSWRGSYLHLGRLPNVATRKALSNTGGASRLSATCWMPHSNKTPSVSWGLESRYRSWNGLFSDCFFFLGDCADIHWHRWCGPVYLWWGKGLQLVAMSVRNSWESTCCPTPRDESVRVRMAESQELVAPKDPIVCAKERWIFSRGKHYLRWLVIQPRMNQVATRIVMLLILVSVTKTSQSTLCAWQSNAQQTPYSVFWLHRKANAAFSVQCVYLS